MRTYTLLIAAAILLGTSGFSVSWAASSAKAAIVDVNGKQIGTASLKEAGSDVKLSVKVKGLTQGEHGMHIHAVGKCEGPEFKSAGAHYNPHNKQHGLKNPQGAHVGDLPDLTANKKGKARVKTVIKGANLQENAPNSLLTAEGTAIVIHAGPDDDVTDPSGNSGGRVACGVIQKA